MVGNVTVGKSSGSSHGARHLNRYEVEIGFGDSTRVIADARLDSTG